MTQYQKEILKYNLDQIKERVFKLHSRLENEHSIVNDKLWVEIDEHLTKINVLLALLEDEFLL
jgi:CRISPR/Cas system-associated protein Csx1